MKHLQQRAYNVRGARTVGCLLRKAEGTDYSQSKRKATCPVSSRSGKAGLPKPVGTMIMPIP